MAPMPENSLQIHPGQASEFSAVLGDALQSCQQTAALIINSSDTIEFASKAAAKLLQRPVSTLQGISIFEFLTKLPVRPGEFDLTICRPDGTMLPVSANFSFHEDQLSNEKKRCLILSDASDRLLFKQLQESEKRFRMLAENAPVIIWVIDERKNATYYNKMWLELQLASPEEEHRIQVHPDDRQRVVQDFNKMFAAQEEFILEYRALHQDGTYHWLMDHGVPRVLDNGRFLGYVGTIVDINRQVQLKESLATASLELERKVTERTNQLATANRDLEREKKDLVRAKKEADAANEAKSRFLATMSHEIRTPIGAMLGFAEIMQENSRHGGSEALECADGIVRNGRHLLDLVSDILDLSAIEKGKLKLIERAVDIRQMLPGIIDILRPLGDVNRVGTEWFVSPEVPNTVHTDPTRLRQILINLIGNAFKFTCDGSICVQASFVEDPSNPNKGTLRFDIKDTGIGVDPAERWRLFDSFSQLDNGLARRFEGTGLGLSLARKLARAMGGNVSLVCSEKEVGSTFRAEIHCRIKGARTKGLSSPVLSAKEKCDSGPLPPLSDKRLLLVEDCEDNQLLYHHFLSREGAKVDLASSGREALELMERKNGCYDTVLVDIQMPEMDGFQLTSRLRESGFTNPVIALTALALDENRKQCMEAGCSAFLTKPIARKDLVNAIEKCLTQ